MLRMNKNGELVETLDYNIHGDYKAKTISKGEAFRKSMIGSEKDIIEEDEKRKNLEKMREDYNKAWMRKNHQKVLEEKQALRNYERKVLQDQENLATRDKILDNQMKAYYSYKDEAKNPNYNKAEKTSSALGWGHFPPSKDYNVFHSGLKFGMSEGHDGKEVITYGHLSKDNSLSKEKYLNPQEEREVRKGMDAGIEKRVSEADRSSYQANASFSETESDKMQGMGDFWSDLRDDFVKDVKQNIDEELTYENLKDVATEQIKKQLAPEGGQVETMPDGTRVVRVPGHQPMMIPQPSGIDTKTMMIAGGALIGTVLLVSLLRR